MKYTIIHIVWYNYNYRYHGCGTETWASLRSASLSTFLTRGSKSFTSLIRANGFSSSSQCLTRTRESTSVRSTRTHRPLSNTGLESWVSCISSLLALKYRRKTHYAWNSSAAELCVCPQSTQPLHWLHYTYLWDACKALSLISFLYWSTEAFVCFSRQSCASFRCHVCRLAHLVIAALHIFISFR